VTLTLQIYAFVWGAVWGSFLNVVIYRLPRELSLVRPGSRCGSCETPVRWYDNVPIISYLVLRGRCRACGEAFSPRYALVEAACGVLSLALFDAAVLPLHPDTLFGGLALWAWYQVFVYGLVAITFIDLEWTFIPDELSLPATAIGVGGAFAIPRLDGLTMLYGAVGATAFLMLVYGLGWLIFRREAMGLGDVKLLAMIGAFLGWKALPFVLFASAVQALIATAGATLWSRATGRTNELTMTTEQLDERFDEVGLYEDEESRTVIPYGPFLALAAIEALLFGDTLLWDLADYLAGLLV